MKKDIVKFMALGGLDENGKNMYCLEVNNEIFIIDAGIKYPESQHLGIDIEVPTFDYLLENKDKVKAVFLTHAHPDNMGAITYLIKELNIPIYTSNLTAWIVEDHLKKEGIEKYQIKRFNINAHLKIGETKIFTFKTTHSIIQSFGLAFESKHGYVVLISDFIVDFSSQLDYQTDLNKLVDISRKGVLALMCESVAANNKGYTSPKHKVTSIVEPIISEAKNRIIVSAYTHSMYNIQEIVNVAVRNNYRVLFLEKDLQDLIHKHEKLGQPIIDKKKIAPLKDIDKGDVLVIISGVGAQVFEKLSNIATDSDEIIKAKPEDTFIIASPSIPGIENLAIKAIDDIYRLSADVYMVSSKKLSSMHASEEDLKMMISILKPKYYIPIKGEHVHLSNNANIALNMGIPASNIIVLNNGEQINIVDGDLIEKREQIKISSRLIDGQVINNDNGVVLNDRLALSNDGTIIIGIGLDRKSTSEIIGIDVQTRGFVYIKDSEHIIEEIRRITEKTISSLDLKNDADFNDAKSLIRDNVSKYVYQETNKRPIILSMIVSI